MSPIIVGLLAALGIMAFALALVERLDPNEKAPYSSAATHLVMAAGLIGLSVGLIYEKL